MYSTHDGLAREDELWQLRLPPPHRSEEEEDEEGEEIEEEYLVMDYASEIEECSRYVFSDRPYCRNATHAVDTNDNMEDWMAHHHQQHHQEEKDDKRESAVSSYDHIALRALISEARHKHLAHLHRTGATSACVMNARRNWRTLAHRTAGNLESLGYKCVLRLIAARCLFNPEYICLHGDDFCSGAEYASALAHKKERLLQLLRERNILFFSADTTPTTIVTKSHEEECGGSFSASPAGDVLSPLCVCPISSLHPGGLEALELPLPCDGEAYSMNSSLGSGDGASSSSGSDTDDCDSLPLSRDDARLNTVALETSLRCIHISV